MQIIGNKLRLKDNKTMKIQTEGQSEHGETRKKFKNKFDRINIFIGGNEEQI